MLTKVRTMSQSSNVASALATEREAIRKRIAFYENNKRITKTAFHCLTMCPHYV